MNRRIYNPQTIRGVFNQAIETPYGKGISFGFFNIKSGKQEPVTTGIVVRLPVNEFTREHLHESGCLTPRAEKSALFVFPMGVCGE